MPIFEDPNELADAARNPTTGPQTGFFENAQAAFENFLEGSTSISLALNVDQKIDEISQKVKKVTGDNIEPTFAEQILGQGRGVTRVPPEFLNRLQEKVEQNPETLGDLPTTEEGILDSIRQEVQASRQEFRDVSSRAGLLGTLGGFAGQAAAATVDPPVLASLALGAPASAGILRTALTEAGISAATEAPIQAIVQQQRDRLGLDAGVERALKNIALAGVGGGVLAGGARGIQIGARKALGFKPADAAEQLEERGLLDEASQQVEDAANVARRQREIESQNPFVRAFPENNAIFQRVFDETLQQIRDEGLSPKISTNLPVRDDALPEGRPINQIVNDTTGQVEDIEPIQAIAELGKRLRQEISDTANKQAKDAVAGVIGREFERVENPQQLTRALTNIEEIEVLRRAAEQRRREARRQKASSAKKAAATKAENDLRRAIQQRFPNADEEAQQQLFQGEHPAQLAFRTIDDTRRRFNLPKVSGNLGDQTVNAFRGLAQQQSRSVSLGRSFADVERVSQNAQRILDNQDENIERLRQAVEDDMDPNQQVSVRDDDGNIRETTVRAALDDLDQDERLANEIRNCLGGRQQ